MMQTESRSAAAAAAAAGLLLALAAPAPAAAQAREPGEIRQTIEQLTDATELRRLETTHARAAESSRLFTAGFAALRLTDLTGKRDHARRGRGYFDRIADREPQNAWAHYGYALSFRADIAHVPGASEIVTESNALRVLGLDAISRARRALERAVRLDASLPGARELLAAYAAETRDREGLELARNTLRDAHATGRATTTESAALAATLRQLRDYEGAADVARQLTATGQPPAAGLLELARALAHLPGQSSAAGEAYLRAVELADDSLLERIWADARLIARAAELDSRSNAALDARRDLLQRFWALRAALAGSTASERIAEHYRRLDFAAENYPRRGMYGAPPSNALELRKLDDEYDDRGLIYIRHGEPRDIIRTTAANPRGGRNEAISVTRWESWAYDGEDGRPFLVHFALFSQGYVEPNDGCLMEPPRPRCEPIAAGTSVDYLLVQNVDCGVVDERHVAYDRRLTTLMRRCSAIDRRSIGAEVRQDARAALRSESMRPALDTEIPFHFDHYTFRGSGGETELVLAVGVPLARIDRERAFRLSLTVVDTSTGAITRTETHTPAVSAEPAGTNVLRTHLISRSAPAQNALYRIALTDVEDGRAGKLYGGPIELRAYRGDTLMVSDVVLAEPVERGSFTRGAHSFALAPTQVFARGEFRVFYELYNLAPRTAYRTEISVQTADSGLRGALKRLFGREAPVVLAFDGMAPDVLPDGVLQEVRNVQAPLPPGVYRLKVTISAAGMRRPLVRERRFTIE